MSEDHRVKGLQVLGPKDRRHLWGLGLGREFVKLVAIDLIIFTVVLEECYV
jgi:hypothetical protein